MTRLIAAVVDRVLHRDQPDPDWDQWEKHLHDWADQHRATHPHDDTTEVTL